MYVAIAVKLKFSNTKSYCIFVREALHEVTTALFLLIQSFVIQPTQIVAGNL